MQKKFYIRYVQFLSPLLILRLFNKTEYPVIFFIISFSILIFHLDSLAVTSGAFRANMMAGSIFFLKPGTTYDVKLTLSDPPASMPRQFMTLKPGCNAQDAGIVLPNINMTTKEQHLIWAPMRLEPLYPNRAGKRKKRTRTFL